MCLKFLDYFYRFLYLHICVVGIHFLNPVIYYFGQIVCVVVVRQFSSYDALILLLVALSRLMSFC